ncbi:hypothetical protein J2S74_005208 [Evansella vedderi]|uniref:Uncharacterized protein n=1 Tax=Evansella vedderi TaxID=38282 RepID=A0ABU0A2M7_9BACI|nr:hypothetical protein [Evansella vedderi]MDQ0257746.1 hypothetical protein [Evansella vedderi]
MIFQLVEHQIITMFFGIITTILSKLLVHTIRSLDVMEAIMDSKNLGCIGDLTTEASMQQLKDEPVSLRADMDIFIRLF